MQTVNEWGRVLGGCRTRFEYGWFGFTGWEQEWVRAVTLRSSTRSHATVPPPAELLVCAEISLGPACLGGMRWSRSTWRQLSPVANPYQSPPYFLLCLVHTSLPALSVFSLDVRLFPCSYRRFQRFILHDGQVKERSYLLLHWAQVCCCAAWLTEAEMIIEVMCLQHLE